MSLLAPLRPSLVDPLGSSLSGGGLPWDSVGGGAPWTPAALGSKLTLWLRPSGIVGSSPVTAWTNHGSAGGSFAPAGSPVAGTIGSFVAVDFDGTDDKFTGAALSAYFTASQFHVFAVANLDAVDSVGAPASFYTNDAIIADVTGGYIGLQFRNNASVYTAQMGAYDSAGHAASGALSPVTGTHMYEGSLGTDKVLHSRVDAGSDATDTMLSTVGALTGTTQLGASYASTNFLNGRVAEILVCNAQLSAADVALVRGYLTGRYGPF